MSLETVLAGRAERAFRAREAAQRRAEHDDDPYMIVTREIEMLRAPQEVTIVYSDAQAHVTTRTIQIRNFTGRYIEALCLLRRDYRTFLVERVVEAYDLDGVLLTDLDRFLETHYGDGSGDMLHEARQRQRYWRHIGSTVAPEALLLRLVAAADGRLDEAEANVITERVLQLVARRDIVSERSELLGYIRRLSGTRETVAHAFAFMASQSKTRRRAFGETCLALVEADGEIGDEEIGLLRALEDAGTFG